MSRRLYSQIERTIIGLMLLGIAGMFQPFALDIYRYGFILLLVSTILFIVISHMSPKWDSTDAGSISVEQAAEPAQRHEQ